MNNINFILKKIKNKNNKNIIWSRNKYYKGDDLEKRINFCRKVLKKSNIKKGDLVAFESDFEFQSIAFFLACILECLIVIPVPIKQKDLLKLIPCNFFDSLCNFCWLRIIIINFF